MSAVLTICRGFTAINDETTAEPRRSWRWHCCLCRTSTALAPRLRCDGGIRNTCWAYSRKVLAAACFSMCTMAGPSNTTTSTLGVMSSCSSIGLSRENAIAIESDSKDPFGGNVYYVTMRITLPIPEFSSNTPVTPGSKFPPCPRKVSAVPPQRSAVPPQRSAISTVFRGATAITGGTTAIMAVPVRFMPYKHRRSTAPPV